MSIAQSLLPEFDHEAASTRALLAVVPEAKAAWKPHPKSMALGELAAHLVDVLAWVPPTALQDSLDVAPVGGPAWQGTRFTGTAALLALWDQRLGPARAAIAQIPDAAMHVTWKLLVAGQTKLAMPRVAVLRSFILNHLIHHRGQLTVYLRLQDVPLPQVYGPTADHPAM